MLPWILLAALIVLLWLLRPRRSTARPAAVVAPPPNAYHWPEKGEFEFDIVGESFHQPALVKLAASGRDPFIAALTPERDNPHDRNAVRVDIESNTVGHLSKDDAPRFRRRLGAKKLHGVITTCAATITGGGTMPDGRPAMHGVRLDIKPFDD